MRRLRRVQQVGGNFTGDRRAPAGVQDVCGALQGVRVVELGSRAGAYCGKMLAGLGAEVILVEPPGGCELRREPPFAERGSDTNLSLPFAYYSAGKRSVILDLDAHADRDRFRALVGSCEILIEAETLGTMTARGLGYSDLRRLRPALVMASISPFGQDGPRSLWKAGDIVAMALGGMMALGGYKDSPPLRPAGEQAFLAAGAFAAVA